MEDAKIDDLIMEQELGQGVKLKIQFTDQQKEILHKVFALYEENATIKEQFKKRLEEEMAKYHYINKVKDWWDGINVVFQINKTGTILANANANKYDSNVPIFED